jgi:GntR family transcriptional regulator/MocR family aminotransferase
VKRSGSVADDWASSPILTTALAARGGRRVALEEAIRDAIRSGRLQPSDPLPSSRSLAADLGLARGTVAEAYAQLTAEGYLTARPGAPTRVAAGAAPAEPAIADRTPAERPAFTLEVGVPDVAAFPRAAWIAAMRRALRTAPSPLLALGDPRGSAALREALATHLRRTRGVVTDPARIVVTCGFSHGLAMLCRTLRATGLDEIAMEDPCLHQHRTIAAGASLRVRALPVDEDGASASPPAGTRVAIVTPAHQFPLGMTLAPARRNALIAWAAAHDALIVEDDYDGEYRYDHQPVGALQGLDPERVVYAGTVSKTLAPALRLGWLVLPQRLVEPALEAKDLLAGEVSTIEQLTMAELLQSGAYDRHVRRTRLRYRRRRDLLIELLAAQTPPLTPRGIAAGLHVVAELPADTDEDLLMARAADNDLALNTLTPYWHDPTGKRPSLILGYAAPPDHAFAQTLALLARVLYSPQTRLGRSVSTR